MSLNLYYQTAIEDYHRMRRRAGLQKVINRFRKQTSLFSYEDIRRQLRAVEKSGNSLEAIPLEAIQGSVGRYSDFTRDFLPTKSVDPQRWARVKAQFFSMEGVPPIEVYKIGQVYFVSDGNHRVSVAREMGNSTIDAFVREVSTKVPLEVDDEVDQLLIKAEYTRFLEQTRFDQLYPDRNLLVTTPGRYIMISQQIEAIHFAREIKTGNPIPYSEAVQYWYENIYDPIVEIIREQDILKDFPERTETDLFIWIFKHRASLTKTLGWEISPNLAAKNLVQQQPSTINRVYNQSRQLFNKVIRQEFDAGPAPGTWRKEKMTVPEGRLFANIIVIIDGFELGWEALTQGISVSELEGSQLFGLHVSKSQISESEQQAIQAEFGQRWKPNIPRGQLAFEFGHLDAIIKERAGWADLVILSFQKTSPIIQSLVQTCPAPLLIIKGHNPELKSILLAYDGSPKSEEALFLAAYLATFWELSLTVIIFPENEQDSNSPEIVQHAKDFLEYYGVTARYPNTDHDPVEIILSTAQDSSFDLIVLGGYSAQSKNRTNKRVLDEVLEKSQRAILICR